MSAGLDPRCELVAAADAYKPVRDRLEDALRAAYAPGDDIEWLWFGEARRGVVAAHGFDGLIDVVDLLSGTRQTIGAAAIVAALR